MKLRPSLMLIMTLFFSSLFLWGCGGGGGGEGGGQGGASNLYLACRPVDSTLPDRFYLIDTAANVVTQTDTFNRDLTNNAGINAIAVKPDGSQVYLARADSSNGSTVEIFDGITGTHVGTITLPTGALPRAGVVTPDGKTLYVVDQDLGTHVVDATTNTYKSTMPQTKSRGLDIAMSKDGTRLYTTLSNNVFVLDATTNSWVTTITGDFTAAYQVIITPGATDLPSVPARVYLSNNPSTGTKTIVAIDPATNTEITSIPVTDVPGESAAHPDGRTAYVVVGTDLAVIDVATNMLTTPTSVTGVGDLFNHVVVAPDGKKLYLLYRKSSGTATLEIKVFDLSTDPTAPTLLTTIADPSFNGCYAPLGLEIRPG